MMLFPKQLITKMLIEAIASISSEIPNQNQLPISLKFCHPLYDCDYTSAFAYQLSSYLKKPPQEIAKILLSYIPICSELTIATTAEGMLNFALAPIYISKCLEVLLIKDLDLNFIPTPQNFPLYTHTQYAYARCCAILRLAEARKNEGSILKLPSRYSDGYGEKELQMNLIAISESLPYLSGSQAIKQCQHITAIFLEFYNRTATLEILNEAWNVTLTKKLIYTLAQGYIALPNYL